MEVIAGGLAAAGACLFTNPMEVVKNRLQLQVTYFTQLLEQENSLKPPQDQQPFANLFSGYQDPKLQKDKQTDIVLLLYKRNWMSIICLSVQACMFVCLIFELIWFSFTLKRFIGLVYIGTINCGSISDCISVLSIFPFRVN